MEVGLAACDGDEVAGKEEVGVVAREDGSSGFGLEG